MKEIVQKLDISRQKLISKTSHIFYMMSYLFIFNAERANFSTISYIKDEIVQKLDISRQKLISKTSHIFYMMSCLFIFNAERANFSTIS
jgi:hypothetical protein